MSDPKLISPLLDGFAMGAPMSSHDGVECCPAIKEDSDKKYIVKIISVPATQTQLDAMLLAGAYQDPADAMDYFRQVGEDIMKEAELLTQLSKLEGFLPYDGWQMEPITSKRLGYQVYLVGSYKRTLEKYVRRNPVTHLEAVNVGLDLCQALMVCRQAGAIYVDLKPTNVFMSDRKEYRIGDLGFVRLDALKYTELPNKYRSPYTPPELHESFATLNLTLDTYAVGMILYQLYNDGQLPFKDKAPAEALPSPANADYELAEIIMKAIHPDPAQRWEDPRAMGQALVGYMQRNSINDTPITPYVALDLGTEESAVPAAQAPAQAVSPEAEAAAQTHEAESAGAEEESTRVFSDPEDETLPGDDDAETLLPHEMSDDLSRIMAKAEDLISHEAPQKVVVPQAEPKDPFGFVATNFDEVDDSDVPYDPLMEDSRRKKQAEGTKSFALVKDRSKIKKLFSTILTLAVLGAIAIGLFWGYQNYYLQTIDSITVTGDRNQILVAVDTDIEESKLTITCSDNYGNVMTQPLKGGKAVFTELRHNTMYRIEVKIDGFHSLVGQTSEIFSTDASTSILSFTAVTGSEDGSAMLSFTADGDEPEEWILTYGIEGGEEKKQRFSGHNVTVTGLSVGKVYTFTLSASNGQSLSGQTSIQFMGSRLILAENLTITSNGNNDMTVHWNAPGDIRVDSWNVRCYNTSGYEEQRTVTQTQIQFTNVDPAYSYTVEVTAAGMTQAARTSITANPIHLSDFQVDESNPDQLTLNWTYTGNAPEGGWLVMYSVDGSSSASVTKCTTPSAVIKPRIPGATYKFTVQAADATSIFGNVHDYTCQEAPSLNMNDLTASKITMYLLKRPEDKDWTYEKVSSDSYQNQFVSGDKISMVLHASKNFYLPGDDMKILYVVEDAFGNVLPKLVSQTDGVWKDVWFAGDYHYGELNLPTAPTSAGSYKLKVYFSGQFVAEAEFRIS